MTLLVDNSILKSVATCSTQALLRYHYGWDQDTPRDELQLGTAAHAALASYLLGGDVNAAAKLFEDLAPAGTPDTRTSISNTTRIMGRWLTTHPLEKLPFKALTVEQPFRVPLCGGIDFIGVWDGIGEDNSGRPWLIEHKTTGWLKDDWWTQYEMDSQLSGYIWAARQLGHDVMGAYLNGIEFSKLPSYPRQCQTHSTLYSACGILHANFAIRPIVRTTEMLETWHRTAVILAHQWMWMVAKHEEGQQEGQFTGACRWCQFQPYCRMGRPAGFLQANYTVSHWRPLERGR